ncbi:sugar transferase [Pleionea litopenaei]|uniref:Sugar transferase n=1 Tax=Pleionea litopenaei TaxID=3070815 RepID=A0AA51RTA5_9GAMM|nr:sugar transferase [Pleionea sp. HL-JVS1]WMS87291.1 sugar transferase [Pleionea sp. HL-JVS1]
MLNVIAIRFFDIVFSLFGLVFGLPLMLLIAIIGYFDTKSPIFMQTRIGLGKREFTLVKFRTMRVGTASVATHLANSASITKFGNFLRRSKLDELPQLWNVLKGDMSLVGPRPNLPTQAELITCRDELNIYSFRPGITGLAQIMEIDMSKPELLAKTDAEMLKSLSVLTYFKYILLTAIGKGSGDRVKSDNASKKLD